MQDGKKILIILGHPDSKSFCGGLADAYESGAKQSKFQIKRINLGKLKFDPILHNGYNKIQILEPDLVKAQKDISWADHIVWIFPSWWSLYPAIMKGFIDRIFLPGFSFKYTGSYTWNRLLPNKTSRIIMTMGGPAFYYNLFIGAPAIQALKKGTLEFCGIKPVYTTLIGQIRKNTDKTRIAKIISQINKLGIHGK
ncbi:NAD(P)H-dependent oxidoreductase [Patescibacteria group bacterium]|nr:NAD(P)H-dependent oxidoreductase [Patescibacteria group bacterium]